MKKDYDFEMFLKEHGDTFSEYLSYICTRGYASDRYGELDRRMGQIFEDYPKIAAVIDMDQPKDLTEEECKILIEMIHIKNAIDDIGMKEVYFKGCMDCVKYLKMLNLLAEVQEGEMNSAISHHGLR